MSSLLAERRVTLKSTAQIEKMAVAGRLVGDVLDALEAEIRPGITTADLDVIAFRMIRDAGATPSFIGVPGRRAPFRHTLCISIDSEVVHGIPGTRKIREGEIVSVDAGAIVDGWHGDSARSFIVGQAPDEVVKLVEDTRLAMYAGIAEARPGNYISDIGGAIEEIARANGYGIVRAFVGHGIGNEMHEEPQVPNYRTGSRGRKLETGLCLAIEPMFTLGSHEVRVRDDGWTVETVDGRLAAHWEHTVAITSDGPRVLTESHRGAAAGATAARAEVATSSAALPVR